MRVEEAERGKEEETGSLTLTLAQDCFIGFLFMQPKWNHFRAFQYLKMLTE